MCIHVHHLLVCTLIYENTAHRNMHVGEFVNFYSGVVGPKNGCVSHTMLCLHTGCHKKLQKKRKQRHVPRVEHSLV